MDRKEIILFASLASQTVMSDPRIFFAAERTLLAWIRTGLTVIALGFVVARFGLFLNLLARQASSSEPSPRSIMLSNLVGILLVVIGAIVIYAAALQHRGFLRTLSPAELPLQYRPTIALLLAFSLASLGLLIAAYLALSTA
jgi:putative membrane protein